MFSNREILEIYLNNGLIKTCVECQFSKLKDREYEDDYFQDLCVTILEYDNNKLNDAHKNNHFNALITRMIINNIFSSTSPFYRTYIKFNSKCEELNNYKETNDDEIDEDY